MFKKDSAILGLAISFIIPIIMFTIIYFGDKAFAASKGMPHIIPDDTKYVISIFFNLIFFRLYMINWKLERTGKGILGGTFLLAIIYIILFQIMDKKAIF